MNEIKLKPCPFCGSIIAPRVMDQNEAMWIGPDPDYDGDLEIVVCCASRKGGCGASTGLCDTSERAVEAWNKRAEKTGKWIIKKDRYNSTYAVCSECGANNYAGTCKYCFECGAKMESEVLSDD